MTIHILVGAAALVATAIMIRGIIHERRLAKEIGAQIKAIDKGEHYAWWHQHRGVSCLQELSARDVIDYCQHIVWDYARQLA